MIGMILILAALVLAVCLALCDIAGSSPRADMIDCSFFDRTGSNKHPKDEEPKL